MLLTIERLSSPIGTLLLVSDEHGRVRVLDFDDYEARMLRGQCLLVGLNSLCYTQTDESGQQHVGPYYWSSAAHCI
jgi:methylated-DNA-[protein]-cysteine S-methyltransferase